MFLQALHLVLNISHVLETLLFRNRQLVFNPALGLTVPQINAINPAHFYETS